MEDNTLAQAFGLFQQLLFFVALVGAGVVVAGRARFIARNIKLGQPEEMGGTNAERWKKTLLIAFGQKKMFDRPFLGAMHFVIYAGFLIINIEILEIVLDGMFGTHRLFAPFLGATAYQALLGFFELLALGVVLTCVVFLLRRNAPGELRVKRFTNPEMEGWPTLDANLILVWEIALMAALYTMNATDAVLQGREGAYVESHYHDVGGFLVSGLFTPLFEGMGTMGLIMLERVAWWAHILGIMGFAIYVTYSKHLHIFLAFPNTYWSRLQPQGEMENMPKVTAEVKSMLDPNAPMDEAAMDEEEEIGRFGAKDVTDLSWKNLMDAYSCTECGRCTSECPANLTGKKLSPRKIMMDTRDRLEEVAFNIDRGHQQDDGKSLYGDYVTKEELMACTTCNACVTACPVNISPLDIILKMRRYVAMEETSTPPAWNAMFSNVENNFAPWAFAPTDRFKWADELAAETSSNGNGHAAENATA